MKIFAAVLAVAVLAAAPSFAKEIIVTDAKIAGGKLKVTGTTPGPNQNIKLDDNFTVMSDASNNFSFALSNYFPATCIANLAVGAHTATAVVANCATLNRGADVNGAVSFSPITDGLCRQFTLSVGGAKIGEVPLIETKAAMQSGVFIYATSVLSANHVTVNVCNLSGGAMTPINDLPVRVITLP